jgi:hypothetical protein
MGFMAGKERRVFEWSQGARGHYERKRRAELIEKARYLVLQPSKGSVRIEVEVRVQGAKVVDLTEEQEQTVDVKVEEKPKPEPKLEIEEDTAAWDFDDDEKKKEETKAEQNANEDGDGWGFEDDGETNAESASSTDVNGDDPWAQEWNDPNEVKPPTPPPPKRPAASAAQKGQPSVPIQKKAKTMRKESYLVSQVATVLASIAGDVLREGSELLDSRSVTLIPPYCRTNVSCTVPLPTMGCPRQTQHSSCPPPPQYLTSSAHSTQFLEPLG